MVWPTFAVIDWGTNWMFFMLTSTVLPPPPPPPPAGFAGVLVVSLLPLSLLLLLELPQPATASARTARSRTGRASGRRMVGPPGRRAWGMAKPTGAAPPARG